MATNAKSKSKSKSDSKDEKPKKKGFPFQKGSGSGKGKAKAKSKKKPLPVFKAPEDFKPFYARVNVRIDKDGIISDLSMTRIKGSPSNENAKTVKFDLYDPATEKRFAARYCAVAFVRSDKKRLPENSMARFLLRVSSNKETGALKCSCKEIALKIGKDGKAKMLDKKDPYYRNLRKPMRFSPAAFTKVKPFPSAADIKALEKARDGEE